MTGNDIFTDIWDEQAKKDAEQLKGPIVIFGASGFIGANLFYSLRRIRDDVFAASRAPEKSWRLYRVPRASLLQVDITNAQKLQQNLQDLKPRTVFNLAAYGGYSRQRNAELIHATNYMGAANLMRAMYEIGCDAFVQTGSSSEYGLNCAGPAEDAELKPNSDYAVAKVGAAYLTKYFGTLLGLPCVNLRLYSTYGPWEERDRLIPSLVSAGLQKRFPPFVNPDISRDFVYVDDCTSALTRACNSVCQTHPGRSYNIATGSKTTIRDVAVIAKGLFDIPGDIHFGEMPNRNWDLAQWYGDPTLTEDHMGWKGTTDFAKGLALCAQWEKEFAEKLKFVKPPAKDKKLSMIIACYKDNQAIPVMHRRITEVMRDTEYDYEIIFVNDGSPADDEKVIEELTLKDSHTIGISHARNFGSQSAFISGMELATGDAVVLMDGDLQDPPEIIPQFIEKWEDGYDVVYGARQKREAPLYMQFFYKMFYRLFRMLSDISVPLDAGDFSLIDRKAVDQLLNLPEKDLFLRGLRAWIGFRQIGVPYVRPERLFGTTTNNFFKNIWWAKKGIFSFSMKPLHLMQAFGLIMLALTITLGLVVLINYFIAPPSVRGITAISLLVLGLGSVQIIFMSILGDYIGKITEEVKNRPRFIRDKILFGGNQYNSLNEYKENKTNL